MPPTSLHILPHAACSCASGSISLQFLTLVVHYLHTPWFFFLPRFGPPTYNLGCYYCFPANINPPTSLTLYKFSPHNSPSHWHCLFSPPLWTGCCLSASLHLTVLKFSSLCWCLPLVDSVLDHVTTSPFSTVPGHLCLTATSALLKTPAPYFLFSCYLHCCGQDHWDSAGSHLVDIQHRTLAYLACCKSS